MDNIVAVIGGGPAGMMAAYAAAKGGNKVVIIEKNDTLGKKLLITGKGRCNITNSIPIEDFLKNIPVNPSFMYSSLYGFSNTDLMEELSAFGLEMKTERGGRVFPVSDKSKDVLNTLIKMLKMYSVKLYKAEVIKIEEKNGLWCIVTRDKKAILAKAVIVATGGVSYPLTGSTGDGYKFAKSTGHTVTQIKPSLVPLEFYGDVHKKLMGLSLKNISVRILENNKQIYDDFGEMIFTHFGASGPVILSSSSHMKNIHNGDVEYKVIIDLKPALDFETLDLRVLRDFNEQKNKDLINSLNALLPKKMIPVAVELAKIDPRKKVNEITKLERHSLVSTIKNLEFKVKDFRPVKEAIITSGGVSVKEINPKTMESKLKPGLYFAGEVLDVDGYTGGFNLQIAFSTGYAAGNSICIMQ